MARVEGQGWEMGGTVFKVRHNDIKYALIAYHQIYAITSL